MIAAEADARQFIAAPQPRAAVEIEGVDVHILAADVNASLVHIQGGAREQRSAGLRGPLDCTVVHIDRVELAVAATYDNHTVINKRGIPYGCTGLNGPGKSALGGIDGVYFSFSVAKENFIAIYGACMKDRAGRLECPDIPAALIIDCVQDARHRADKDSSIGYNGLHARHQAFVGKKAIPLSFKRRSQFGRGGPASSRVVRQHGPAIICRSIRHLPK